MRLTILALLALLGLFALSRAAAQGVIAGTVLENGKPVESAAVYAQRLDKTIARESIAGADGSFRLAPLTAGIYTVTVRKVGYRSAEQSGVRVAEGQTVTLNVLLTQAPRLLSTIRVITSPTSIDASTPEVSMRLDRQFTELLPGARDASSLIALVPGARKDQLWGGAPGVSNDYQVDGVSMNHPGLGGDFLGLSVDWIETLDVRGLGAGAEQGNFQGGIINAITRTGTNEFRSAVRTNVESARLTATNLNANEQGIEQAGRREFGGEALGPIARDRLFYFVGGQIVRRDMRSPNLSSSAGGDFQPIMEEHADARGLGKLTWLPALGQRMDLLLGHSAATANRAGINGIDEASATRRLRQPTTFYELRWTNTPSARNALDIRVAGFSSRSTQLGYAGPDVPGVRLLRLGTTPTAQNAEFNERREPSSISGSVEWRISLALLGGGGGEHQLVVGADVSRGGWRDSRTRNGGMTWRPYATGLALFNPEDASTWTTTGSDWGGEMRLTSDVASEAVFLQDNIAIGTRLTLTPGIRFGRWTGYISPDCAVPLPPAFATVPLAPCYRFDAAHAEGLDPRIGFVLDVTGRNTVAFKAHWGRYHQGMFSLFFDRAMGANVYGNSRFYYSAPLLTDSRQTFTTAQRDAPGSGFSSFFDEVVLNESGRVERYRQPYVDQAVLGLEKSFGPSWKVEVTYTTRRNGDIVGLIDRNRSINYSPIFNVGPEHRLFIGAINDAHGNPLELPVVYVSNKDLYDVLHSCGDTGRGACPNPIAGYKSSDVLPWYPDVVLTTIPEARRHYRQLTLQARALFSRWQGEGSITTARLRGNIPGVTGYGTTGSRFSAGPFARPNEAINFDGPLPDALEMEGKVWLTASLSRAVRVGMLFTHTLGERFAPTFELSGRYVYTDSLGTILPTDLFKRSLGQSILVEPRGTRQYASRDVLDAHLEWSATRRAKVLFDLFNVLGSDALTLVNTNIGDQDPSDRTSVFGAPRLRVAPRTLRVGMRID